MKPAVILITGATACGKSAAASRLAEELNGVIINADSMQMYRELRILTARPSPEDERRVPHRLFGVWSVADHGSAGLWLALAREEIEAAIGASKVPILVGGTGFYFQVLLQGLAPVPDIADAVRLRARALLDDIGNRAFHQQLAQRDPVMAARLKPNDRQRMLRAYEVIEATGWSLAAWHTHDDAIPRLELPWLGYVLSLPRQRLYDRIEARFDAMIEGGALDEIKALMSLELSPDMPALRALGIPELMRHLAGELSLDDAAHAAKQATRRYAKRQMTWQRNKMHAWMKAETQDSECFFEIIFPKISHFLLTTEG